MKSWTTLRAPAHPRSRGENTHGGSQFSAITGSSPLTRGKPGRRRSPSGPPGLIPAHAGKTASAFFCAPEARAHPRSRGENSAAFGWINGSLGSSPLTRGKRHLRPVVGPWRGPIPAHAGKTLLARPNAPEPTAHPRSRGENACTTSVPASMTGSSPLTRGKPRRRVVATVRPGLIPAHAGKTGRGPWGASA